MYGIQIVVPDQGALTENGLLPKSYKKGFKMCKIFLLLYQSVGK